ncbi:transposase, partial [Streptomyces mirabilis]|uniref:transposase n=1 Tax=Streptomyces mirabilis TaxID=68239 RepID=UPI0036CBF06C
FHRLAVLSLSSGYIVHIPSELGRRPDCWTYAWRLSSQVTRLADLRFFPGQQGRPSSTLRDVESRSTRERPLCMSLPVDAPAGDALGILSRFRVEFYECLYARQDALFELTDAVLCADGPVKTLVELSLAVEHRRGHGALYGALDRGWLEPTRLRRTLAGLPLPKAADGRIVLAVDVSNWLRPDAPTSDDRLFCHVYGRGDRKTDQFVPGWPYSFVAALESGRTSWVALLDAVRLGPADDATAVTATQLRDIVGQLTQAGHWRPGDLEILIVMDAGYDVTYLSHALADLPVVLVRRHPLRQGRGDGLGPDAPQTHPPRPMVGPRRGGTARPARHVGAATGRAPAGRPRPETGLAVVLSHRRDAGGRGPLVAVVPPQIRS